MFGDCEVSENPGYANHGWPEVKLSYRKYCVKSIKAYLLRQMKRADVEESSLLQFYTACIRSILKYGCQVFHSSPPDYLSMDLERVQRRALKIIYPELNSEEAIKQAKMTTLKNRREKLSQKLFTSIQENREHKLYHLLPEGNSQTYNLRELRRYKLPIINTNRLKNSWPEIGAMR